MDLVASKLGVTPERLQQAFTEARQELGMQRRPDERHRGREGLRHMRGMMQRGLEIVAGELHISVEQLRTELPGSSVAAVSRAHGVDPQQVATALKNAAGAHIDAAAGAGRITSDQASRMKQRVGGMIERMLEREVPVRPAHDKRAAGRAI
jgi:hypothetical protein